MKKLKLFSLMLMLLTLCVPMTSCSDDEDDEPAYGTLTVINNSTYSLSRFTIHFVNDDLEEISSRDFGTFEPGDTEKMEIPAGATKYYFGTYISYNWYFSAYYKVNIKRIELDNSMVGQWKTNSYTEI